MLPLRALGSERADSFFKREGRVLITLTTLTGKEFVLNSNFIETVESIPETKVCLTNGKYFLVRDSTEEIIKKVIVYNRKVFQNAINPNGFK